MVVLGMWWSVSTARQQQVGGSVHFVVSSYPSMLGMMMIESKPSILVDKSIDRNTSKACQRTNPHTATKTIALL
jgi:hypothetical protein